MIPELNRLLDTFNFGFEWIRFVLTLHSVIVSVTICDLTLLGRYNRENYLTIVSLIFLSASGFSSILIFTAWPTYFSQVGDIHSHCHTTPSLSLQHSSVVGPLSLSYFLSCLLCFFLLSFQVISSIIFHQFMSFRRWAGHQLIFVKGANGVVVSMVVDKLCGFYHWHSNKSIGIFFGKWWSWVNLWCNGNLLILVICNECFRSLIYLFYRLDSTLRLFDDLFTE